MGVRTDRAEIKLAPNWQARGRVWHVLWGPAGPGKAGDLDPLQSAQLNSLSRLVWEKKRARVQGKEGMVDGPKGPERPEAERVLPKVTSPPVVELKIFSQPLLDGDPATNTALSSFAFLACF